MLGPGSPLRYDLVSVPDPVITADTWGLADRLPRAVPLDLFTAGASWVLGGWVSQALGLTALTLAGLGAARFVQGPVWARAITVVVAQWNPFVAEQLSIGHVPHLMAYGAMPWVVWCAYRRAWLRLATVLLLGSLTPGGGVLCVGAALAGALVGVANLRFRRDTTLAIVALAGAMQAPWVVSGFAHPPGRAAAAAVQAFGVRAETQAGPLLDVLGLGGMWNASALPLSRFTSLSWLGSLLLLWLAALGSRGAWRAGATVVGARAAGLGLGLGGLGVALFPVLPGGASALSWLIEVFPAAGLLRDGHRWLAPWALLLAICIGYAGPVLASVVPAVRRAPAAVAVAIVALCVAVIPDLAWGLNGQLAARQYPADWQGVRSVLDRRDDTARMLVLPWQVFRLFPWAGPAPVLDPAPRWFPREPVVADKLLVSGRSLGSEGQLSAQISADLGDGRLTQEELDAAGIGWVLIEQRTPGVLPVLPSWPVVYSGPDLVLRVSPQVGQASQWATSPVAAPELVRWALLTPVAMWLMVLVGVGLTLDGARISPGRAHSGGYGHNGRDDDDPQ